MYQSSRPNKERKQFYGFMERNKRQGQVGRKKVGYYIQRKGYTSYKIGKGDNGTFVDVVNKRGTPVAELLVKKKHITWWCVK